MKPEGQIRIIEVSKKLKGIEILKNINVTLPSGGIYGFYGPNGSGKTMLFRAISGLIHLTTGEIQVFGQVVNGKSSFPKEIGLAIESVGFWNDCTGYDNLKLLASLQNKISKKEIYEILERVGLRPDDKRVYKKYSLGMKQRLAIAQAIMERPRLIILDEPTNALDDDGVQAIHEIIRQERKRGATILLASHRMEDLDLLCDRKFRMAEGALTEVPMPNQEGERTK